MAAHDWEWEGVQINRGLVEAEARLQAVRSFLVWADGRLGGLKGKQVLELGSGLGRVALLMALRGSRATLVDEDPVALGKARELFALHDLQPETLQLDLLRTPPDALPGGFDVVMSWGLVEHFLAGDRLRVAMIHAAQARSGGLVAISVPNALSPPYALWRFILERTGRWPYGDEFPLSEGDLRALGRGIGIGNTSILLGPLLETMDRFFLARAGRLRLPSIRMGPLDHLGYQLVLVGTKG